MPRSGPNQKSVILSGARSAKSKDLPDPLPGTPAHTFFTSNPRSIPRAIGIATLIAGALDITDALLFYGIRNHITPKILLQSIASHVTGREVFHGGITTAFAGLVVHFLITLFWATLFILAARRLHILFNQAIASGILYGLFIYLFMNYVVLPNITLPTHPSHVPAVLFNAVLALVFFIGLPIALVNRRFAPPLVA